MMKPIHNLLRLIVGISMPTAGFFLFMIAEGPAQMMMSAGREGNLLWQQSKKDPTALNLARYEGAKLASKSFREGMGWYMAASGTGFITSSVVCILAMRAGRRIKHLIDLSKAPSMPISA
ncbi:MAG: hypothetical protein EOP84_08525 [Verrucomicrobiaceae bacterium]|nr:MAG: hypothetical protein EOP84_08525 [Verrucomicrobiaceae bacterium]